MQKSKNVQACLTLDDDVEIITSCEIFLPERITEKPKFVFRSTDNNHHALLLSWKCKLKASLNDLKGDEVTSFQCDEVYLKKKTSKQIGLNTIEYYAEGEPENLMTSQKLQRDDEKHYIEFWISPNKAITPTKVPFCRETVNNSEFSPIEMSFEFRGKNAKIENRYRHKSLENGDNLEWSYLVVLIEYNKAPDDQNEINLIMKELDEFLSLVSFLTRWRTGCLGWNLVNHKSIVEFYRGNYAFPKRRIKQEEGEYLIYPWKSIEIFKETYKKYQPLVNKDAILQAIHSVIPKDDDLLEASFLSKFSGLEALLLRFKKEENLENILDNDEWLSLKKHIKKSIRIYGSGAQQLPAPTRSKIYTKLEELNRVSLKDVFTSFNKAYHLDLSDLWPLFREDKLVGLADIRNYLIHGEPIPSKYLADLSVANQNLTYILERCLCAVLTVSIEETFISKAKLASLEVENTSSEARLSLSMFIVKK